MRVSKESKMIRENLYTRRTQKSITTLPLCDAIEREREEMQKKQEIIKEMKRRGRSKSANTIPRQYSLRQKHLSHSYRLQKHSKEYTTTTKKLTLVRDDSSSIIIFPEGMSDSDTSPWSSTPTRPRQQLFLTEREPHLRKDENLSFQSNCINIFVLILIFIITSIIIFFISYFS